MNQQRVILRDIGNDTHVRNHTDNNFKKQSHDVYGMQIGEISMPEPEPLFAQNMVTVKLARGGKLSSVGYPGAFFDPVSGNLHGAYEGPIKGQMVIVGFENGNQASPFVVNRYPYQGRGNTLESEAYSTPLTKANFDSSDVIFGHYSGSYLAFYTGLMSGKTPGSFELKVMTEIEISAMTFLMETDVEAEIKSPTIKFTADTKIELTGPVIKLAASTQIELNGNTDNVVKYIGYDSDMQSLITQINSNFTALQGVLSGGGLPWTPVSLVRSTTASKADKVKL